MEVAAGRTKSGRQHQVHIWGSEEIERGGKERLNRDTFMEGLKEAFNAM